MGLLANFKQNDVFRDEKSLAFDGTNDFVDCGSDSSLDVGTNDFSVSAWCKVSTKGGSDYHDIVAKGNTLAGGNGFGICLVESDKKIFFDTNGDVARQNAITSSDSWEFGKWYHIVGTRSNSADTLKLYINGVLVATNTSGAATNDDLGDASINFKIGTSQSGRETKGNISEVAYYNSVLTANQVKTIYNGREPYNHKEGVASSNLKAWYRMGDGALDGFDSKENGLIQSYNSQLESSIVTSWTNNSFNTLNTTGTNITSMINNDSGTDNVRSNSLTVATTDTYKISFDVEGSTLPSAINKLMLKISPNTALNSATYDGSVTSAGKYVFYITPATTTIYTGFRAVENVDCSITNFKMQKVTNNSGLMNNMAINDFEGDTP